MTREYTVIIEKGSHSWGAYVPDLPGCVAVGKTEAESRRLIREAIGFHLEALAEENRRIPAPRSHAERIAVSVTAPA